MNNFTVAIVATLMTAANAVKADIVYDLGYYSHD